MISRTPTSSSHHVACTRRASGAPAGDARPGMTLVELLVVLGIIITVFSMTVPTALSLLRTSGIREAARILQAQLAGARERALFNEDARGLRLVAERDITGRWVCRSLYAIQPTTRGDISQMVMTPGAKPIRLPARTRIALVEQAGGTWVVRSQHLPGVDDPPANPPAQLSASGQRCQIIFNDRGVVDGPGAASGLIYLWLETDDSQQRVLVVLYTRTGLFEIYEINLDLSDPSQAAEDNPLVRELIPSGP